MSTSNNQLGNPPQVIRALSSRKEGQYNISPTGGKSYDDRIMLSVPDQGVIIVRRSDPEFTEKIQDHLNNGYAIINGRLNANEVMQFGAQKYIDSILNQK